MISAALFVLPWVLIAGLILRDWIEYRRHYDPELVEESWECENCGYHVTSSSLEGVLEGIRLHDQAIYCPGDEDDDDRHYQDYKD